MSKFCSLLRGAGLGLMALAFVSPALAQYPGSGAQPVTRGGTGKPVLTQNALIFGNGTAPVGFLSPASFAGRCVVSDGTIWAAQYCLVTGSIVGTAPVTVNVALGAATVALTIDSNFAVVSQALALNSIPSGQLLANGTAGSAEPTATPLTNYLDRALGSANGDFAARIAGTWTGAAPGTGLGFTGSVLNLQPAAAGAIGGVNSIAQVAHQVVQYIDTAGLPHLAQLSFADISGQWGLTQGPTLGANTVLGSIAGGTPTALSPAQLTSLINLATASLSGAVPAWPNNATTYFRGDGTYATLNFAALGGIATAAQLPFPTASAIGGVQSKDCSPGGQFVQKINTDGTESCGTPAGAGNVTGSGTSVSGHVAVFNNTSATGIQDGGTLITLLNAACTLSPSTCAFFFGYYNVIWYGADPTGVASSQTAINNAIAAACTSSVRGVVWAPLGSYLVNGGLNATNISAGCTISGSGLSATVFKVTAATNAILDMTGSSAVSVNNFQLTDTGAFAQFALLLSTSGTPASPCNVNHFKGISITGHWIKAGINIYDCSDSSFENSQVSNFNTAASACVWISNTNDLTASSSFTTITTATGQSGDWRFSSFEIHDLSVGSGTSTVVPLFISGLSSPIKFIGGVVAGSVAAASGGNVTFGGVPTGPVSFIGTQMYADNGTPSKFAFWTYNTFTGLVVQGSSIQYGTSLLSQANGASWTSLNISGNATFGTGSFVTPATGGSATITRSILDAQGLAINLGSAGVLTHSVVLQPGTITAGTNTNNGSF